MPGKRFSSSAARPSARARSSGTVRGALRQAPGAAPPHRIPGTWRSLRRGRDRPTPRAVGGERRRLLHPLLRFADGAVAIQQQPESPGQCGCFGRRVLRAGRPGQRGARVVGDQAAPPRIAAERGLGSPQAPGEMPRIGGPVIGSHPGQSVLADWFEHPVHQGRAAGAMVRRLCSDSCTSAARTSSGESGGNAATATAASASNGATKTPRRRKADAAAGSMRARLQSMVSRMERCLCCSRARPQQAGLVDQAALDPVQAECGHPHRGEFDASGRPPSAAHTALIRSRSA